MLEQDSISLVEALLGLLFLPQRTLERLFRGSSPPFVALLFALFFSVVFIPVYWQALHNNFLVRRDFTFLCLTFVFLFTSIFFCAAEFLLLKAFGVVLSFYQTCALFSYACTPLSVLGLLLYALNLYDSNGQLSIPVYLNTGYLDPNDSIIPLFPLIHLIAKACFLWIFYCGLKIAGGLSDGKTLGITLLSSIPFYAALLASLELTELWFPGALRQIWLLITWSLSMVNSAR